MLDNDNASPCCYYATCSSSSMLPVHRNPSLLGPVLLQRRVTGQRMSESDSRCATHMSSEPIPTPIGRSLRAESKKNQRRLVEEVSGGATYKPPYQRNASA